MASIEAGLCRSCAHARVVQNRRGSSFLFCGLSRLDSGYPRYPTLPVRRCDGHRSMRADQELGGDVDDSEDEMDLSPTVLEST